MRRGRPIGRVVSALSVVFAFGGYVHAQNSAAGLRVAVLVDTSQGTAGSMNFVRSAVAAFISRLAENTEVGLATTGRRLQVRLPPTTDRAKAMESAKALTSDGGGTVLMDGLLEVDDRFLRKAGDRKPVLVIVTGDGSESSKTDPDAVNRWLNTLRSRGLVAYAVVLKTGNGAPEAIANAVSQATGGRCETVGNGALLQTKMEAFAEELTGK